MPAFQLRAATAGDAMTIAALATQVFLDTYATDGVRPDLALEAFTEYSIEAFAARLGEAERRFVVAETGEGLMGFAEVLASDLPAPAGGVSGAHLVRLYVQPQAQGTGVGRALIEAAERMATERSVRHLWLIAWEHNERAIAFYLRHGYAEVGTDVYTFQHRSYGTRILAKRLR
jgi:ribosomal protein S18 acetylase RimI-like enzyme